MILFRKLSRLARAFVLHLWISYRLLMAKGLGPMGWVALGGLSLGVASLVVSMAVVSGFESTLRRHIIEVTGHLQLIKYGPANEPWPQLFQKVQKLEPDVTSAIPFVRIEALAASQGKVLGVLLQGFGTDGMHQVLKLCKRLVSGQCDLENQLGNEVLVGRGVAQELGLKPGDEWQVVIPLAPDLNPQKFRRKLVKLKVLGILDLGKYEFDQRMILASMGKIQEWAELKEKYLGLLMKSTDDNLALQQSLRLGAALGRDYRVWDWREVNSTLFQAVQMEKPVIFIVIALILIAAAVNVSTSLNISVVQKFPQIAVLKSLGLSQKSLRQIFITQGMTLGMIGCCLGLVLGFLLCFGFTFLETKFGLLPGSVYKIDRIELDLRAWDLGMIVSVALFVCFVAVRRAATRGSKLPPVEGLRYE